MSSLFKKYFNHKTSIMPDIVIPHAIAYTGISKNITAINPEVMIPRFRIIGAEAGAAKRSKEFRIPA